VKLGIRSCDYFVMEIDSLLKKVIFLAWKYLEAETSIL
jgi:hypothetical protein